MELDERKARSAPLEVQVVNAELPATSPTEQAFARLYERALPEAVAFASSRIGDDVAQEVVHDAALELWRKWAYLTPDQHTVAYFIAAVKLRVGDQLRRATREDATFIPLHEPSARELAARVPDRSGDDPNAAADDDDDFVPVAIAHADGRVFYPEIIPSRRVVAEERAQQALLARAVDRFTKRERQIWGFCVLRRLTTKEAAGILEISPVTARRHLSRAIAVIRDEATRSGHTIGEPALQRFLAAPLEVDND